ncbi:hypothetical protein E2C01_047259 [Portunus trituberculatus]|uniref:Uncharacterized protein n=1 Tax=Portunus trituberculatus TaxID=210409 RepID=A0A5B7FZZ6_PORTR|nr:hypothetical protein [Portunus trituberculatus]
MECRGVEVLVDVEMNEGGPPTPEGNLVTGAAVMKPSGIAQLHYTPRQLRRSVHRPPVTPSVHTLPAHLSQVIIDSRDGLPVDFTRR